MARAKKVEEVTEESVSEQIREVLVEVVEEAPKKTRCDFGSWKEYHEYKGAKA